MNEQAPAPNPFNAYVQIAERTREREPKIVDLSLKFGVEFDFDARTIRPLSAEGDEFFGLSPGSNGTAATTRRACVEGPGFSWVRFNGRPAVGTCYVVPEASDADPDEASAEKSLIDLMAQEG